MEAVVALVIRAVFTTLEMQRVADAAFFRGNSIFA